MKENLKLGMILFIITAVAGLLLGMVYDVTKEPIALQEEKVKSMAVKEVLPMAKEVKKAEVEIPSDSIITEVNAGYADGKIVGYTIRVAPKGYNGQIDMLVGVSEEGRIEGVKIINQKDTPGLGANMEKDSFRGQFKGKAIDSPLEVVKTGVQKDNQIDAMAGATISSNGVTFGVNEAVRFYRAEIKGDESAVVKVKTKDEVVKELIPETEKIEASDVEIPKDTIVKEVEKVLAGDKVMGYVIMVTPEGYHEKIEMLVVISTEGKVLGINIMKHTETPGLGAEAVKEEFTSKFKNKDVGTKLKVVVGSTPNDNQIDAISGATITTEGVVNGVNKAAEFYLAKLSGKGGQK